MKLSISRLLQSCFLFMVLALCCVPRASADVVPVRYPEGTLHGFLTLRSEDGKLLAVGDLTQVVHGDTINSRLTFRFKDGSIDDEATVFSQRKSFRLITNRHIQKGPYFPHPMDLSIDARSGQVTVRSTGKDGKEEVSSEHMDLPEDLANGLVTTITKNLLRDTPEAKVSMIVTTPKPRVVKLSISPGGEESFSIAGSARKAMRFDIKIELGGVTGLVAPLIGREPPVFHIWILRGEAPAFVREEGVRYEGSPASIIELTSPVWPGHK